MLKWTSESEYFLSFEIFFADTIYQSKSNHFTPSAAHARRGVMNSAERNFIIITIVYFEIFLQDSQRAKILFILTWILQLFL